MGRARLRDEIIEATIDLVEDLEVPEGEEERRFPWPDVSDQLDDLARRLSTP